MALNRGLVHIFNKSYNLFQKRNKIKHRRLWAGLYERWNERQSYARVRQSARGKRMKCNLKEYMVIELSSMLWQFRATSVVQSYLKVVFFSYFADVSNAGFSCKVIVNVLFYFNTWFLLLDIISSKRNHQTVFDLPFFLTCFVSHCFFRGLLNI